MKPRFVFQIFLCGLVLLVFVSAITAFAGNLAISDTNIGIRSVIVTANMLKPTPCNSLNLTNIVRGSGAITGTDSNDLIIGSSGNDTINGLGGNDCILGAGGDDLLDGGNGTDICAGGNGLDTFSDCETEIQ